MTQMVSMRIAEVQKEANVIDANNGSNVNYGQPHLTEFKLH